MFLEVQVDLEDLDAHHNQSLVALVVPGVQKGPLWNLLLDPNIKEYIELLEHHTFKCQTSRSSCAKG